MKPRLLAVEMHHLGDAVLALPFLRAAERSFDVRVACRPHVARFFASALPEIAPIPCEGFSAAAAKIARSGKFSAAVCAWPDARAHALMLASRAPVRAGFRITSHNFYGSIHPWRKRRILAGRLAEGLLSSFVPVLTHPLDRLPQGQSHLESWSALARTIDISPDFSVPWLPLSGLPSEISKFLAEQAIEGKLVCAVHPGGRLPTKRWPVARFHSLLAGWFPENRVAAIIIRAPGEDCPEPQAADQMLWAPPEPASLAPVLATSDAVLCNDSFAAHLAAAVGTPVVSIFGSGDPLWFAPWQNGDRIALSQACPFRPCVDRCLQASPICLECVREADVAEKLRELFPRPDLNL